MVIFVVICNLILTGVNLWLVWWLWRVRQTLKRTTRIFNRLERRARRILGITPLALTLGQVGTHLVRLKYRQLQRLWQQLRQVLLLLGMLRLLRRSRMGKRWHRSPYSLDLARISLESQWD